MTISRLDIEWNDSKFNLTFVDCILEYTQTFTKTIFVQCREFQECIDFFAVWCNMFFSFFILFYEKEEILNQLFFFFSIFLSRLETLPDYPDKHGLFGEKTRLDQDSVKSPNQLGSAAFWAKWFFLNQKI